MTKSVFVSEAIQSGYTDWQAQWWWREMFDEGKVCNNCTSEGSDREEHANDAIWVAVETMAWWNRPWCFDKNAASRKLTYLCRHGAIEEKYDMDTQGGIRVQDICRRHSFFSRNGITENHIKAIVAGEHEIRHAVYMDNKGCLRIKAHQGHSEEVGANIDDAQALLEIRSADDMVRRGYVCCHGTSQKYWAWIRHAGLKTFGRKHIHFAKQIPSRLQTDKEVLILLNVAE